MKKMINIDSNLIKKLRKRTSVSIMECKKALIQANGDFELAVDNIRKFGLKIAATKCDRTTLSGLIVIKVSSNKQYGVMVEINCETDFVAKENIFKEFANVIVDKALNENIHDINVLHDKFDRQRTDLIVKTGENINIRRFVTLCGTYVSSYVHIAKIGVLLSINNDIDNAELIKNIAMHIAAKNPKFININDVPKDVIIRERRIQREIVINFNKSKDIIEKIVMGKMNKFFNEIVLTKQNFILDENKTVGNILDTHHIKLCKFVRFKLGDNNKYMDH